ncbi:Toll-like receptor 4 [Mytilus coruscus]|uniref:Toll-like receptor 4 n=1 Tax=Mytilus coruscus TaxID=42192 RepID=A0A6J8BJQ4_MYTCO|nr:Toll-like receptor 4 [Mytilus coruscus]
MYYMTKSKYYRYKPDDDNESYTYNAFISYSDMEKDFVVKECIPILDQDDKMKLCIHHRDFLPGEEISFNITNAIHESRKTICIITRSFLDSYYCMFEFNIARMESIYSRNEQNILFLIFYEQIQPRNFPLVMLELVQNKSYIEYPHDEQGNDIFWEKVKEAIA